jgi:DNA polymerase-3 subunit epsilon
LDIPIENRHRAGGDADATAILFSRLMEWDSEATIEKMVKKTAQDQRLPPNLPPEDFEQLPEKPGVYYFYSQDKKVIYVGKAVNLKKRVASHFTGHSVTAQRQHFLRDICGISFTVCATELMALLLEFSEIKKLWPAYNRALKRFEPKFGLYKYEARNGYHYLALGKVAKFQACIQAFNNEYEGINTLRTLAEKFTIDYRFCKYGKSAEGIFFNLDTGTAFPDVEEHNQQVESAINFLLDNRPSFAIIDKGRDDSERSCIWVENGDFYGMGYIPSDRGFNEPSEIKDYVTPGRSSNYIMQLIGNFAKKHPQKVKYSMTECENI